MSACADRPGEKQAAGHAEAGSKIQWVPVGLLLAGDSPRLKGENAQHIRMLANSEVSLPAILVHRETMRVVDGMHRLRATLMKGQETIEVQFFEGSEDEAFIRAIAANTEHGLPLTLADRRAAAARITVSHPRCSDRWIAQITGLASGTVATIRTAGSGHSAVPTADGSPRRQSPRIRRHRCGRLPGRPGSRIRPRVMSVSDCGSARIPF